MVMAGPKLGFGRFFSKTFSFFTSGNNVITDKTQLASSLWLDLRK